MSRRIITVMDAHSHVQRCLTQAEVYWLAADKVATTIRNHVIEACNIIDAELATPTTNDMAKCAEALAVLSEGVRAAQTVLSGPGEWRDCLNARIILDTAQRRAFAITEGETP